MRGLDWSDGIMLSGLVLYALAISRHISLGRAIYVRGQVYPPLSTSAWVPSETNARQVLLYGLFWIVVPLWAVHVLVLALVLFFEPRLIPIAGSIAAVSTGLQGIITFLVLGTSRAPGKILVGHYLLQTVLAAGWAIHHACGGCGR